MTDPYLFTVTNNVATFSINDPPWNLMSIDYIDRLEEQLPEVLADDAIRAMVFTGEGLDHFSAGMNLRQLPEGIKRAGSPDAFFGQRHRVLADEMAAAAANRGTADSMEGMRAFMEKRKPVFNQDS